jgi:hypothetical protein
MDKGKGKDKYVTVLHDMKICGEVVVWLLSFLTSVLGGKELPASGPGRFTSVEMVPVPTEWETGRVPKAVSQEWICDVCDVWLID